MEFFFEFCNLLSRLLLFNIWFLLLEFNLITQFSSLYGKLSYVFVSISLAFLIGSLFLIIQFFLKFFFKCRNIFNKLNNIIWQPFMLGGNIFKKIDDGFAVIIMVIFKIDPVFASWIYESLRSKVLLCGINFIDNFVQQRSFGVGRSKEFWKGNWSIISFINSFT